MYRMMSMSVVKMLIKCAVKLGMIKIYNRLRFKKSYVGQSGRSILTCHKEHVRYIKTNKPISAYALHILNNQYEFGPPQQTL
jgi:hypothetical protein